MTTEEIIRRASINSVKNGWAFLMYVADNHNEPMSPTNRRVFDAYMPDQERCDRYARQVARSVAAGRAEMVSDEIFVSFMRMRGYLD